MSHNSNLCIDAQSYDIESATWTTYPLPERYRRSDLAAIGYRNYAYFIAGYDASYSSLNTTFAIHASTTSSTSLSLVDKAEVNIQRGDCSVVATHGKAYLTGGFGPDFCEPLTEVEEYDVEKDTWTTIDSLHQGRGDKALVTFSHLLFAFGGERQIVNICSLKDEDKPKPGELTIPVDDVEMFDPFGERKWKVISDDLPFHRFRFGAVGYDSIRAIYMFGGQVLHDPDCDCFRTTDEISVYSEKKVEEPKSSAPLWTTMSVLLVAVAAPIGLVA